MKLTCLIAAAFGSVGLLAWRLSSFFTPDEDLQIDEVNPRSLSQLLDLLKKVDELRGSDQQAARLAAAVQVQAKLASLQAKVSGSIEHRKKMEEILESVRLALKEEVDLLSSSIPHKTYLCDTDFAMILILFGCGVAGSLLTKRIRRSLASVCRLNFRKLQEFDDFDCDASEKAMASLARKKVAARPKRKELTRPKKRFAPTAFVQQSSLSPKALDLLDDNADVELAASTSIGDVLSAENSVSSDESTASPNSSCGSLETPDFDEGRTYGHALDEAPVLFRPLPSDSGEQLYTDGHFIYRIACVPITPTALHEVDVCNDNDFAAIQFEDNLRTGMNRSLSAPALLTCM